MGPWHELGVACSSLAGSEAPAASNVPPVEEAVTAAPARLGGRVRPESHVAPSLGPGSPGPSAELCGDASR